MLNHVPPLTQPPVPTLDTHKIRVLLADDHHLVRKTFATLLSSAPQIQVVEEAESVSGLINQVKKLRPHVLILNAKMPDGKALFTSQSWRKGYPDVRILLLSPHEPQPRLENEQPLNRSVRLVAGRDEEMSRRVMDILLKPSKEGEGIVQPTLFAKEIWV